MTPGLGLQVSSSLEEGSDWTFVFRGWCSMQSFCSQGWAVSNVEGRTTFRQTLQVPSSRLISTECSFLVVLCRKIGHSTNQYHNIQFTQYKTTTNDHPTLIHPEDGNLNNYRNVGQISTFNAAHPKRPKYHTLVWWPQEEEHLEICTRVLWAACVQWRKEIKCVMEKTLTIRDRLG
jgi:hypothetical protein